jgi:hypothetical protein
LSHWAAGYWVSSGGGDDIAAADAEQCSGGSKGACCWSQLGCCVSDAALSAHRKAEGPRSCRGDAHGAVRCPPTHCFFHAPGRTPVLHGDGLSVDRRLHRAGATHTVWSGVALVYGATAAGEAAPSTLTFAEQTQVTFAELPAAVIEAYIPQMHLYVCPAHCLAGSEID